MITAFIIALILSCAQRISKAWDLNGASSHPVRTSGVVETDESRIAHTKATLQVDHAIFDELLGKYVDPEGRVRYSDLKSSEAQLDRYLNALVAHPPSKGDSRSARMAYWINAYNAYTIKVILKNYPVSSIMDLEDGNIWDVRWIEIEDRTLSLNDIEHEILRAEFGDARIHFAVNCAAASCPPLWNRAFTATNLEEALTDRTSAFINDDKYNQIFPDRARLSRIFDWYRSDFGDLTDYINEYSMTQLDPNAEIAFNEYDWSLNER